MFFQWLKMETNLTDGVTPANSVISGSATGTLTLANIAPSDAATYTVLISNLPLNQQSGNCSHGNAGHLPKIPPLCSSGT